jgi:hypothetical protein
MGLGKDTKPVYVNLSDGRFYESEDKEKNNPYGSLEGLITGLSFRDDMFENNKIRKCVISMTDGANNYVLNVRVNSSYFGSFVSFLKNADLSQPIKLKPGVKKDPKSDKTIGTLFVEQGGSFLKQFYTKDKPNGLPPFQKKKVNGNIVWDKTDYLEFLENVVEKDFKPQLRKELPKTAGLKSEPTETFVNADEEPADDLPF